MRMLRWFQEALTLHDFILKVITFAQEEKEQANVDSLRLIDVQPRGVKLLYRTRIETKGAC